MDRGRQGGGRYGPARGRERGGGYGGGGYGGGGARRGGFGNDRRGSGMMMAPPKLEVFTSSLKLLARDGVPLPSGIKGEGCAWVDPRDCAEVGRTADETELVLPLYKQHDTNDGADPFELYTVTPLEIDLDNPSIPNLQEQVLRAMSAQGVSAEKASKVLELLRGHPTLAILSRVFVMCKAQGKAEVALEVFRRHQGAKLADATSVKVLATLAKSAGSLDLATAVMNCVLDRDMKPDVAVVSSVSSVVLSDDKHGVEAADMGAEQKSSMLVSLLKLRGLVPGVKPLADGEKARVVTMLSTFEKHLRAVAFYLKECDAEKVALSAPGHNAIILSACHKGDVDDLCEVLDRADAQGVALLPDVVLKAFTALRVHPTQVARGRRLYRLLAEQFKQNTPEVASVLIALEGRALGAGSGPGKKNRRSGSAERGTPADPGRDHGDVGRGCVGHGVREGRQASIPTHRCPHRVGERGAGRGRRGGGYG
eukprot:TRINITY_DN15863_c0_g1_i1.p1 TRINITY_DN15863_c0_g1~~TRINITY_DN15863_c0_g1_i1.p1  ORF type:complete len:503 (+),score=129.85 TRINITY_DN15863_c0_g1_i1:69-1511(+)